MDVHSLRLYGIREIVIFLILVIPAILFFGGVASNIANPGDNEIIRSDPAAFDTVSYWVLWGIFGIIAAVFLFGFLFHGIGSLVKARRMEERFGVWDPDTGIVYNVRTGAVESTPESRWAAANPHYYEEGYAGWAERNGPGGYDD